MKRSLLSLFAAIGLAGAALGAQSEVPSAQVNPANPGQTPRPPATMTTPASTSQTQDQMVIGCLVQGSGPTVFVLENAKLSTAARADKGTSYIVTPSSTSIDLKTHLNHQVSVAIPADAKLAVVTTAPGAGAGQTAPPVTAVVKLDEKDMTKITARSVTMIADTCTTVS